MNFKEGDIYYSPLFDILLIYNSVGYWEDCVGCWGGLPFQELVDAGFWFKIGKL